MAVRADAYRKSGGFHPTHVTSEDTHLALRLMKLGRYAFAPRGFAHMSMRRVRKWGYVSFALFHTGNFISTHFLRTPAKMYAPIR